ncbi:GTPase Der [Azospirillaceae bacterium]
MGFTAVIIGRPNVGKSTLFNRLAGRRLALVDDAPGVTRDWRAAPARIGGLAFTIIDTAGLEDAEDDSLEGRMRRQTEQALERADVVLMLVDARTGITSVDQHFATWLRKTGRPVILIANKCEGRRELAGLFEAYELGLGEPVAVSAAHGEGMAELVQALAPFSDKDGESDALTVDSNGDESRLEIIDDLTDSEFSDDILDDEQAAAQAEAAAEAAALAAAARPLQLAIVGRPNVGKSTLLNSLIGEQRVLTGPEAGMTRDAISVDWRWKDRPLRLVDTAGMRRKARIDDRLERMAVSDALRVIRMAHVVVLTLDAAAILDKQDLTIARMVLSEGRALVLAVNKWDETKNRKAALETLRDRLESALPQARGVPWVTISALRSHNLDTLLDAVLETYRVWNQRVPTAQLNRWLIEITGHHPPPLVSGRRLKFRYMTQIKTRPPTFALWASKTADEIPDAYLRYLTQGLRNAFALPGVPLRLYLRKARNPYADS